MLKNAIDTVFATFAFRTKPVACMAYSGGIAGGTRAIEHLAQIAIEAEMVPLRNNVIIPFVDAAFGPDGQPDGGIRRSDQMTSPSGPTAAPPPRPVKPVPPSRFVKTVMGPMTKVLNPLIVRLAGRRHFHMAAQLTHAGRRSGRTYVTPVGARRVGDMVLIPLTFGNQSDWSRNVLAAGRCCLRLEGVDYEASAPALVSLEEADSHVQAAFGRLERSSMRMLGIRQFLRLSVVPTRP